MTTDPEKLGMWLKPRDTARLHLLPAKAKPIVAIIRRKPSKVFHVMKWHLRGNRIEHGSWFNGTIYSQRCDVSWNGEHLVYLAMGSDGKTWNGVSRMPWLKAIIDAENVGTWGGGGCWSAQDTLAANTHWHADRCLSQAKGPLPYRVLPSESGGGEDLPILTQRFRRDGWKRLGPNFGRERRLKNVKSYAVANEDDNGWAWQPTPKHPVLQTFYRGYFERGYTFEFMMPDRPEIVTPSVEWATWTSDGQLVLARDGVVEQYTLQDLRRGHPKHVIDLNPLQPPWKDEQAT